MMQYERISTKDYTGKRRTILLLVQAEGAIFLKGEQVDKHGERVDHIHYIDKGAITKRTPLTMNNTYGELE